MARRHKGGKTTIRPSRVVRDDQSVGNQPAPHGRLQAKLEQIAHEQAEARARTAEVDDELSVATDISHNWTRRIANALGWCLWLVIVWFLSSIISSFVAVYVYRVADYDVTSNVVGISVMQVAQLVIMLAIAIGVPYRVGRYGNLKPGKRRAAKMSLLGISRLPELSDLIPLLVSVVVYYIGAFLITFLASLVLPDDVIGQTQNVSYATTGNSWPQIALIILVLAVVTPVFEELLFRGFLLGKLQGSLGFWTAAIITSLIFAAAHGQINVGLTTFVLSMIACYARHRTGAVWVGIGLHMVANFIAAILVFVVPMLG